MAKSNKNLFGAPPKLPSAQKSSLTASAKTAAPRDSAAKALSVGSLTKSTPVNFGSFRAKTSTASQSSPWASLLQHAATGGIASALGGSFSAITGLGGLVSGILNLFGGSSSAPVPVQFVLPEAQQTTLALRQQTGSVSSIGASNPAPVSSGNSGGGSTSGTQTISVAYKPSVPVTDHSQVVQVVRQALLTSSSLNDVIAEI